MIPYRSGHEAEVENLPFGHQRRGLEVRLPEPEALSEANRGMGGRFRVRGPPQGPADEIPGRVRGRRRSRAGVSPADGIESDSDQRPLLELRLRLGLGRKET